MQPRGPRPHQISDTIDDGSARDVNNSRLKCLHVSYSVIQQGQPGTKGPSGMPGEEGPEGPRVCTNSLGVAALENSRCAFPGCGL